MLSCVDGVQMLRMISQIEHKCLALMGGKMFEMGTFVLFGGAAVDFFGGFAADARAVWYELVSGRVGAGAGVVLCGGHASPW